MAGAAIVVSTALCSSASRAAFVSVWDYALVTQFTGNNTFTPGFGTKVQTDTQVSWGGDGDLFVSGSDRSGITLSDLDTPPGGNDPGADPINGEVVTNGITLGEIGLGGWITHHNNPVSTLNARLLTSEIESTLTLVPNTPALAGQFGPATISFTVHFIETTNTEPCVAPSPAGNPCNDIFALNETEAFNQSFVFAGQTYFISIFPLLGNGISAFPSLTDAECLAAGATTGCVGFTTVEGQDSTVRFGFAISGAPLSERQTVSERRTVPEPGSIALLALAFGAVARTLWRRMG